MSRGQRLLTFQGSTVAIRIGRSQCQRGEKQELRSPGCERDGEVVYVSWLRSNAPVWLSQAGNQTVFE